MFIVLEGIDRVGKTTLAEKLVELLPNTHYVKVPSPETKVKMQKSDYTQALQLIHQEMLEISEKYKQEKDKLYIVDRWYLSSLIYQASNISEEAIDLWVNKFEADLIIPDHIFIIVDDPERALARSSGSDVYEQAELSVWKKRADYYVSLSQHPRFRASTVPSTDELLHVPLNTILTEIINKQTECVPGIAVGIHTQTGVLVPKYAYPDDSGFDLAIKETHNFLPWETKVMGTGVYLSIPKQHEIQLRLRSGFASKQGFIMPNAPATVDCGYQGEIKIMLTNLSNEAKSIEAGTKIAQGILCPVLRARFKYIEDTCSTIRGTNGFGSSGV